MQEPSDSAELKQLQEYTQKALERLNGLLGEYTGQVTETRYSAVYLNIGLLRPGPRSLGTLSVATDGSTRLGLLWTLSI